MDPAERISGIDFLGKEFLTWLWFRSDRGGGLVEVEGIGQVELWLDDRVTLVSEGEQGTERVACSGQGSDLKEARFAMAEGKKVTSAKFRMAIGPEEWSFGWEAGRFQFRSMRVPGSRGDPKEDPDGVFLERVGLMERAVGILDRLFFQFLSLRHSPDWDSQEMPSLADWIRQGASGSWKSLRSSH